MKKIFKTYAIIWAIMLAVFNAIVFLVRSAIPGYVMNYDARFWVAWAFIICAFIGNLACAYIAFKPANLQKTFYNVPLVKISYSGLITMVVFSVVLMLIPDCPAWIAAIVCVLVVAFTAVAVFKAGAASEAVSTIDTKVKTKTFFIKSLTVDAETLLASAKTEETHSACKKVFEAVRYSDPMSNDALYGVESQITLKFEELSNAVNEGAGNVGTLADELVVLIGDRNKKCKLLK